VSVAQTSSEEIRNHLDNLENLSFEQPPVSNPKAFEGGEELKSFHLDKSAKPASEEELVEVIEKAHYVPADDPRNESRRFQMIPNEPKDFISRYD